MGAPREMARWCAVGAWGCLVFVVLLDLVIPRTTAVLTVMFGFAPLIACAVLSPAATGAVACVAAALSVLSGLWNQAWGTSQHILRVVDVVLVGAAAVGIALVRTRREEQVARLVVIADVAQRAILPKLPGRAGPVAVAVRYLSAAQDTTMGGDLYDCYRRSCAAGGGPERVRFIVGDVRGKGIAGVEQAAQVIRAFRQSAAVEPTLAGVAQEMDRYLSGSFDREEFVTAVLVDASDASHLILVNCGHPPALLRRSVDGQLSLLDAPAALPLGLGGLDVVPYRELVVPWGHRDRLLLYTDGLSEARDASGTFMSPLALGSALSGPHLPGVMEAILRTVGRHSTTGRLTDDLALLLLEHTGPKAGPDSAA